MKHYQTVDPLQKESQVGRGLFGIRVLILHFKFQFSKSVKSSTFHIFLNVTYPLRKNLSFPKHLKITQKFTQNCQIVDNVISIGIWRRLKRDRDIGRKAVLSNVKTAFTFTPALTFLCTYQCQARGGGGVGHRVGILTFSKKIVKIPTPGEKELSKLAEKNGFLLFYSLKLKDKMHNVRSKSPPWGYTPKSKSRGLPDPPPPRAWHW